MASTTEIVIPLGMHASLYFAPPGVNMTSGTAQEIESIKDATITIEKGEAEVQRRASGGWEDTREAVKSLRIAFNMSVPVAGSDAETARFAILRKTFIHGAYNGIAANGVGIRVWARDVDVLKLAPAFPATALGEEAVAGEGPIGDCTITRFERVETNAEGQVYNVEFKTSLLHGMYPNWISAHQA